MINENIIGEIVLIRDIRYRVLGTVGSITSLCDMDSNKLTIVSYPTDELKRQIRNNEILIQAEESVAIDFSKMSEEERENEMKKAKQEAMNDLKKIIREMFDLR